MPNHPSVPQLSYTLTDFFMLPWKYSDPPSYAAHLAALAEYSLDVLVLNGGVGLAPFDWGMRGPGAAIPLPAYGVDAIHGNPNGAAAPQVVLGAPVWYGRLGVDDMNRRIADTTAFLQDLRNPASPGLPKKIFIYVDFGTQLFGKHLKPANLAPDLWGFWEFYDHWDEYRDAFDLGPKPDSPTTWLRMNYDGAPPRHPEAPELDAFTTGYEPITRVRTDPNDPSSVVPVLDHPFRYAVCVSTHGFQVWWRNVVRWIAKVGFDGIFLDNAGFGPCWNDECQNGFRAWIHRKYNGDSGPDIMTPGTPAYRYFTTIDNNNNLLQDGSMEKWVVDQNGQWRPSSGFWAVFGATSPVAIKPAPHAFHGHFSCRFDPAGNKIRMEQNIHLDGASTYHLSARVYAEGANIAVLLGSTVVHPESSPPASWTEITADFTGPSGSIPLWFEVTGSGYLLLDDVRVSLASQAASVTTFPGLLTVSTGDALNRLLDLESKLYWEQAGKTQMKALIADGRAVNPAFELITNGLNPDVAHISMAEKSFVPSRDLVRQANHRDVGFFPGSYVDPRDPALIVNVFGYRFLHASVTTNPIAVQLVPRFIPKEKVLPGEVNPCAHNPDSAVLQLAEAQAFGGGIATDECLIEEYPLYTDAQASAIRAQAKTFHEWVSCNANLLTGLLPVAVIGVVVDLTSMAYYRDPDGQYGRVTYDQIFEVAHALVDKGLMTNVLTQSRLTPADFGRVHAILLHDIERIEDSVVKEIGRFLHAGGLVFASGYCGDFDEKYAPRFDPAVGKWPPIGQPQDPSYQPRAHQASFTTSVGKGKLFYTQTPMSADEIIAALEADAGRSLRPLQGPPGSELRLALWDDPAPVHRITAHVVNYSVPLGQTNSAPPKLTGVRVTLVLPHGFRPLEVVYRSPEFGKLPDKFGNLSFVEIHRPVTVDAHGRVVLDFPDGAFSIYAVAELVA